MDPIWSLYKATSKKKSAPLKITSNKRNFNLVQNEFSKNTLSHNEVLPWGWRDTNQIHFTYTPTYVTLTIQKKYSFKGYKGLHEKGLLLINLSKIFLLLGLY